MDTVYVIIGWLSIPVTLLSVIWMVVTWRRERNLTARSLWIPILVSSFSLFLYVRLIGLEVRPLVTWLPFFGALALGVFFGRYSRVEAHDDRVVASRSPWSFLLWAASFAATQLVALLAPASAEAMLGLLFAATGLTIGEQMALISARSNELGKLRSALAAAAALLLVVALGATLVPRQVNAADVSVDLQDVAEFELENGDVYEGMSGVTVDVKGVDGTYSGSSIDLTITNDTTDTLQVRVPVGSRLYPDNDGVQTMLTAGDEVIEVPPGQTVTSRIQAYCGEASDGAPSSGDNFTVGEVVTDPALLRSLEEIASRFNDPDSDETFSPYDNQHDAVWSHTDPEKHPPPQEDEVGYDLYNPQPDGPDDQESGTSGGAVGLTNGATAALVTKPSRGGKKGTKKGGKPGSDDQPDSNADSDSTDSDSTEDDDDDDSKLYTDPKTDDTGNKQPDDGSKLYTDPKTDDTGNKQPDDGSKLYTDPNKNKKPDKPASSANQPPGDTPGKPPPADKPKPPTFTVGPVSSTPSTGDYSFDSGDTKISYNDVENSVTYEDSGLKAEYDLDDNTGHLKTKDDRLTLDTRPGSFESEYKDRSGVRTLQGSRDGDTKSLTFHHDRNKGRDRTFGVTSGPSGLTLSETSGHRSTSLQLGDDWGAKFKNPNAQWSLGNQSGDLNASYRHRSQVRLGRLGKFDWLKGVEHQQGNTGFVYGLQKPVTHGGDELFWLGVEGNTRRGGVTGFVSVGRRW